MMSISILRGTNDKPASSQALATAMTACPGLTGQLFIGYPIVRSSDGPCPIDALLVSPDRGIVVFDLVEGHAPGDYRSRQDNAANMLDARLRTHSRLVERRTLRIPVHALSFAPAVPAAPFAHAHDGYAMADSDTLQAEIGRLRWEDPDQEVYEAALSALENISTIRTSARRAPIRPDSRGTRLKKLEASIATLDATQGRAVVETVDGVQRIRGLAGSGKTIVLALKAAYLHVQHPEWRIAVTFHTRSLKGHYRRLISRFHVEQTGEEPDWTHMRIINSWGSPFGNAGDDGLYLEFCSTHDIEYLDFRAAKQRFGAGNRAFAGACRRAIDHFRQSGSKKPIYDAILVDEAQDLPDAFLQICYELLRDPCRLAYAYDELQNLSGAAVSTPDAMFGKDANDVPRVQLYAPGSDIILQKCYRNSRPVPRDGTRVGLWNLPPACRH